MNQEINQKMNQERRTEKAWVWTLLHGSARERVSKSLKRTMQKNYSLKE